MTGFFELVLRKLAQKYLRRVSPAKIIVVTGSIGKTSTTKAITHVLKSANVSVRSTRHNYNTNLGVAVSVLGYDLPKNAKNPFSWAVLLLKSLYMSYFSKNHFDYFVLELGTDRPGDIEQFAWLQPDIAVVTAVAPEHMENFKTIDAVAREELAVEQFSDTVLVNKKMVDSAYLKLVKNKELFHYDSSSITENGILHEELKVIGEHSYDALGAVLWIAKHEGLDMGQVKNGVITFQSPPGRMRQYEGKNGSTLVDDTYNSSPEAVIAAIQYLYSVPATHRIVMLGSMNELGGSSASMHREIGEYCNKTKLDLVVTLGKEANTHTAKSAEKNGCNVVRSDTPKEAAEAIESLLATYARSDKTIILCKGSQNGVFAEEAVKLLLKNPEDASSLVRQSKRWKQIKGTFWTTA